MTAVSSSEPERAKAGGAGIQESEERYSNGSIHRSYHESCLTIDIRHFSKWRNGKFANLRSHPWGHKQRDAEKTCRYGRQQHFCPGELKSKTWIYPSWNLPFSLNLKCSVPVRFHGCNLPPVKHHMIVFHNPHRRIPAAIVRLGSEAGL